MMGRSSLVTCAKSFFTHGKGVLAADESTPTMNKRLRSIGVPEEPEMRRKFRDLLFTAPGIESYLSGAIMYDSSIRNHTDDGTPFVDVLTSRGITPIIKVDKSTVPHTGFADEVVTQGLDDLAPRLAEYHEFGARGAKWRAVFRIDEHIPSKQNITFDAATLARYAALCQEANIVPMVEPEVLFDGDHSLERSVEVTTGVLRTLFEQLSWYNVDLHAVILKTSMVLAGRDNPAQSTPEEVADATARVLRDTVPEDVAGVVFLSGGQSPVRATTNLNAIAQHKDNLPWPVTFSFSRAIEEPVLAAWKGSDENRAHAQEVLKERLELCSSATLGTYDPSHEPDRTPE